MTFTVFGKYMFILYHNSKCGSGNAVIYCVAADSQKYDFRNSFHCVQTQSLKHLVSRIFDKYWCSIALFLVKWVARNFLVKLLARNLLVKWVKRNFLEQQIEKESDNKINKLMLRRKK